jgi:4-diphosphocytidyl-2-C-methyl-D-erythritol kinase
VTKRSSGSPAAPNTVVSVPAPAKINLVLRILDRRPDGFHNLWSVMHTVGLEDEVSIRLVPNRSDIALGCDDGSLRPDDSNLVYRAAAAVLQRIEKQVGLDIALTKRIPMGAGLGGGSSDAAATIIGLNRLLDLQWSPRQMADVGQSLGSDVPFFFHAPCAVVSGRGEQVKTIQITGSRWVVLVNPGFGVETKWAYQQLSATRSGVRPIAEFHGWLEQQDWVSWDHLLKGAENDFERPVFEAHPMLREIKQQLLAEGAEAALLSGSGATVFGVFKNEASAVKAKVAFRADSKLKVFAVPACSAPLACRA